MADTAAFFAKKKKGKKGFKSFNANKIDVASVIPTTHVDAPEVSEVGLSSKGGESKADDGWADGAAWRANTTTTNINSSGGDNKVAELLDMQSLKQDVDVAEKLRIEETKAQLARAKEGMAKEAERVEREKKEKLEKDAAKSAAVESSGAGGKWIPSHLRGSSVRGPAIMGGSGLTSKPNVSDEELFPDLADADKILKEKEAKEKADAKKLASGGGGGVRAPSGWGNRSAASATAAGAVRQPLNLAPREEMVRKPLNLAPPSTKKEDDAVVSEVEEKKVEEGKEGETPKEEEEEETPAAPAVEEKTESVAVAEEPKKDIKLKKKKKKDLSSFKPSG
jgi:hypothetical protein